MIDFKNFKIKRGPSKDLHDPRLIVEEGYWYLSTDKAELFIGIVENGTPVLKPINGELIPEFNLEGYATEDFVREAIKNIDIPEVELYDDSELRNLINSKADSVHSHEEYALAEHAHDEYLTEHQSLAGYATESYVLAEIAKAALEGNDIDLSAYATKEFVAEEINKIEIPEAYDDTELKTLISGKAELDHTHEEYSLVDHKHAEYLTEHQDLSHLALTEHTHEQYLTEHQSLEGYAKTADLFSKSYNDLTDKPTIPSIEGLATEKYVNDAIAAIQEPVEEVKSTLTTTVLPKVEKVDEIVPIVEEIEPTVGELKAWVEKKEYLQDIDLDGYATEEYVDEVIKNIEHPANPTKVSELENDANYTNETKVLELIENNASSKIGIDFVTDIAVGHLAAGTEISKDMTIGQLLYKMLFVGTQPEEPEGPNGVVEEIIYRKLPMYSIDYDGNVSAKDFAIVTFNSREEADQAPVESCFYQVKDETGEIIESGYQDMQIVNDEMYYIIALPKIVDYNSNMVRMQAYDDEEQLWVDYTKLLLTSDPEIVASCCDEVGVDISHINQDLYTVWVNEDTCTGSRLRYIIEE